LYLSGISTDSTLLNLTPCNRRIISRATPSSEMVMNPVRLMISILSLRNNWLIAVG